MSFEHIMVAVEEEFTVRLKSTPSTGYVWEMHSLPENVQLLESDYEKPTSGIRPGDPVIQVFRFRALKAGDHVITLVLKRRWESTVIESYTLTAKVH